MSYRIPLLGSLTITTGSTSVTGRNPLPYPDAIARDKIRDYIHRKTGVMITKCRQSRAIASGELLMMTRPRRLGGGVFSRKSWVDDYIRRNS